MTKPSNDPSIGLWLILTLLLGLKLTVRPDIAWVVVLMPVWIPIAFTTAMLIAAACAARWQDR